LLAREGPVHSPPFQIGGHATETGTSGVVALRLGRDLEREGEAMRVKGAPEAAALVNPPCRKGRELKA
jgi:hypothetical protein